ncbi:MAG TPA: serine acetyltransferase [Steroidobacter sp.]
MRLKHRLKLLLKYLQKRLCCEIPSRYLRTVRFPHPVGIVIGDQVRIGQNVRIYQNVTIGLLQNVSGASESQYPTIEDEVYIYAGAVVLGGITIGARSIIGANALITRDVPPDSIAYGYNQIRPKHARGAPERRPRTRPVGVS